MYKSFKITNFRCFREMTIEQMAPINLVSGKNNVGKTALLEALWLHSGPNMPELGVRLTRFRGIASADPKRLLADLFHDFDAAQTISLSAMGNWSGKRRCLTVKSQGLDRATLTEQETNGSTLPPRGSQEPDVTAISDSKVVFEYLDENGNKYVSSGYASARSYVTQAPSLHQVTEEGFVSQVARMPPRPSGVFLSARQRLEPREDANRFTEAELEGHADRITECLRTIDGRISRLTILSIPEPMVYAEIGLRRLVPMGFLGDGIGRLLTMSLAFYQARDGIILIDEVENGLHHSVMKGVWQNLYALSQIFNVQVFATTHSRECVVAARDALAAEGKNDILFHRLQWQDDQIMVTTYPYNDLDFTLDYGAEIR